jgi:RimJ/RimL family protein N-acetyltransferase
VPLWKNPSRGRKCFTEREVSDDVPLTLRPATSEDRFRIRRWLTEPEVVAGWGNAGSAEAEINLAMGSEVAICRVIEHAGVSIGYAHALEIGLLGDARPWDLAAGTWYVNHLIASEPHRGHDLDSVALALLIEEVFATTLAVACAAVVSIRSEFAARACERAGFRWRQIVHDRLLGPSWLMLKERPI